jgi:predicted amidophosphoribosyltransferase
MAEPKKCAHCGKKITDVFQSCPVCGEPLCDDCSEANCPDDN